MLVVIVLGFIRVMVVPVDFDIQAACAVSDVFSKEKTTRNSLV